ERSQDDPLLTAAERRQRALPVDDLERTEHPDLHRHILASAGTARLISEVHPPARTHANTGIQRFLRHPLAGLGGWSMGIGRRSVAASPCSALPRSQWPPVADLPPAKSKSPGRRPPPPRRRVPRRAGDSRRRSSTAPATVPRSRSHFTAKATSG